MFMGLGVDWRSWKNLPTWLNLGEIVFDKLWELWRKKGFRFVMGAKWKPKFLGSNLSLCPTPLLSDYGGKCVGATILKTYQQIINGDIRHMTHKP
jgi:hypothetical protein